MGRVNIILKNHIKFEVESSAKTSLDLYNRFAYKHPNAWHLRKYMPRGWDGKVHYLSDSGYMSVGLLPDLLDYCREQGHKVTIDVDTETPEVGIIPEGIGKYIPRGYQLESIEAITHRQLKFDNLSLPYPRGIIRAATNAGKNIIMAFIHATYNGPTIILLNRKEFYDTTVKELPDILDEPIGQVNAKNMDWQRITVAMVTTLKARLDRNPRPILKELAKCNVALVDECDLSDNKTYKTVLNKLSNASVRVGLSGSYAASPLKKFLVRDTNIKAFYSGIVYKISNTDLIELGHSTDVIIKYLVGNEHVRYDNDYRLEYKKGITKNKNRNKKILARVKLHVKRGRTPILITTRFHKHAKILYKMMVKNFPKLKIETVNHKTKDRKRIITDFENGVQDILVSTMIVQRAKNFPKMQVMIHAGGGDSEAGILQLFGRATRKDEEVPDKYFEDFFDEGKYLKRHSKHRIQGLKRDGLEIIRKY